MKTEHPLSALILSLAFALALVLVSAPEARSQEEPQPIEYLSQCEQRLFSAELVEGVYDGVECGDNCYLSLKLADGQTVTYLANFDAEDLDFPVNATVQAVVVDSRHLKTFEGPEYYCMREKVAFGVQLLTR